MDNYNHDAKLYENMVKTKKTYEQFGKTDDEVYIRACEYLSKHKNPEDIYNKVREPLKIDIKDPPNGLP
tara:strand:- start:1165 stop:1371 length:207 start_codon:yes stop_codon:yes gene_type:complete